MSSWSKIICTVAALCAGNLTTASAAEAPAPGRDLAWVEKRVADLQASAKERRIDEIGWAKDIREAERLARENNRPVFLFTHDGRINTGRC